MIKWIGCRARKTEESVTLLFPTHRRTVRGRSGAQAGTDG